MALTKAVFSGDRAGSWSVHQRKKLVLIADKLIISNEPLINLDINYGFDSQQSFTRAFHKKYQLPPRKNIERNLAVSIVTFFIPTESKITIIT
uniref:hypothetical protein n=1 Tax=Citrobacter freundii TaxID=546 RepID=UPI003D3241F8